MPDSTYRDRICNPVFRRAVDLLDAGDTDALRQLLAAHPPLVTAHVTFEGEGYFTWPTLLHFVAENPIRHGKLPGNITEVVDVLVEAGARIDATSHPVRHETTLSLVASGCVARECGLQIALLDQLVFHGADPATGLHAALAHGERDAAVRLIALGAEADLVTAACLGELAQLDALIHDAGDADRQRALALAAYNGQPDACRHLLQRGVDPNRYNPEGAHAHATPLHNAVSAGHLEVVQVLIEYGADAAMPDKLYGGDAHGWALHCDQPAIADYLNIAKKGGVR